MTLQNEGVENSDLKHEKRVLVVDNEQHIVQIAAKALEGAGYEVVTAANGEEALKLINANLPDVIISDDMMPRMDGFELLCLLRQNTWTDAVPFVMLTAFPQNADLIKGWPQGLEYYLMKPFNPVELVTLVDRTFDAKTEAE